MTDNTNQQGSVDELIIRLDAAIKLAIDTPVPVSGGPGGWDGTEAQIGYKPRDVVLRQDDAVALRAWLEVVAKERDDARDFGKSLMGYLSERDATIGRLQKRIADDTEHHLTMCEGLQADRDRLAGELERVKTNAAEFITITHRGNVGLKDEVARLRTAIQEAIKTIRGEGFPPQFRIDPTEASQLVRDLSSALTAATPEANNYELSDDKQYRTGSNDSTGVSGDSPCGESSNQEIAVSATPEGGELGGCASCERLQEAIQNHHDANGHGLCWENDYELYAAVGLAPPNRTVPPWPEFMRECVRYRAGLEVSTTTPTPRERARAQAKAQIAKWKAHGVPQVAVGSDGGCCSAIRCSDEFTTSDGVSVVCHPIDSPEALDAVTEFILRQEVEQDGKHNS